MIFMLQLSTYFRYPCRMKWNINIRTVSSCPTNNGATFCPQWRRNITESELWIKSKALRPLRKRRKILAVMHLQRCRAIRRQLLVSHQPAIISKMKPLIIKVLRINVCCARSLEFPSAIINHIANKIALGAGPTKNSSRNSWDGA